MQISSHRLCKSKLHLVATKIVNAKKIITACITKYCCKWLFLFLFLSFLKAEDSVCLILSRLTPIVSPISRNVFILPSSIPNLQSITCFSLGSTIPTLCPSPVSWNALSKYPLKFLLQDLSSLLALTNPMSYLLLLNTNFQLVVRPKLSPSWSLNFQFLVGSKLCPYGH